MLDKPMTTRAAELLRREALRYQALGRLYPGEVIYDELYTALGLGAMCVEKELTDVDW